MSASRASARRSSRASIAARRSSVVAIALLLCLASPAGASPSSGEITKKANAVMKTVYGPCFAPIYSGSLKKVSVVKLTTYTKGVVSVSVYLTRISDGAKLQYDFRVNTGLGSYKGLPGPGTGIPTNSAATHLVLDCPD